MRVVVSEFMSLDGVAQAPGGAEEDTDGGWSVPFVDRAWPRPGRSGPVTRPATA